MPPTTTAPLVLIHGLIGHLAAPEILRPLPAGSFAAELLGYGRLADADPASITLAAQAACVLGQIRARCGDRPVHVLGHSVGGVIAFLLAQQQPQAVASLVCVEGNFTHADATWSRSIAAMSLPEAERLLAGYRAEPARWLRDAGVAADARTRAWAEDWLAHQPAGTLRAMAQSVIATTRPRPYLGDVGALFQRHPVHLLAGERSRPDWHLPDWAAAMAATDTVLPGCGHLMMMEDPAAFGAALLAALPRQDGAPRVH